MMNSYSKVFVALVGMFLFAPISQAVQLVTLTSNGLSANRVDIIFVSEGYTANQESLFDTHVQGSISAIFGYQPFLDYASHFNTYSIFEPSSESGADRSSQGILVDTAFGATFECGGEVGLLCADEDIVNLAVNSVAGAAQRDLIVVLVNDPIEGGSGGAHAVTSIAGVFGPRLVHEIGHSFGELGDEYGSSASLVACRGIEPSHLNISSNRRHVHPFSPIKWDDPTWGELVSPWFTEIGDSFQTSTDTVPNQPGRYEGAFYCDQDLYRPTYNSLMRSEYQTNFDLVNEEILTKRIHDFVSPIDSFSPGGSTLTVSQSSPQLLSIQTLSGLTGFSDIVWRLDGSRVGDDTTFEMDASSLPVGSYTLTVSVTEISPHVRRDLLGQMTGSHSWAINVIP